MADPIATYRLQLRSGLTFATATEVLPYLAALGVSHVYTSPSLQAVPGSAHGYDVVDPTRPDEDLGGPDAHAAFCEAVLAHGLRQVVDVVPNHLAVGQANPWWWDVLGHGLASPFASTFDIDWSPTAQGADRRILLPVLGDHYGRELEAGRFAVRRHASEIAVHYHEHAFPIALSSLAPDLRALAGELQSDELAFVAEHLTRLPEVREVDAEEALVRYRDEGILREQLHRMLEQSPPLGAALDARIAAWSVDALDEVLKAQHYRLAFWRMASAELTYRRFFDVDTLAAVRLTSPGVFERTHAAVLRWVERGWVHGLRVDHIDGLREPRAYLERLRAEAPDGWIVVEKILEPDQERLPADWPVAGTTGYDFMARVDGLFVDPEGLHRLRRHFVPILDLPDADTARRQAKAFAVEELLGSDVVRLAESLQSVCDENRRHCDFTRLQLREAIGELLVSLPVYRTYVKTDGEASPADLAHLEQAVGRAKEHRPDQDAELLEFLGRILAGRVDHPLARDLALRFQQISGSVMAKGVEDTLFYRDTCFVAACEVGHDPAEPTCTVEGFHAAMVERAARHPTAMSALSTHDTKRSADVRARLWALSEHAEAWTDAVASWSKRVEPLWEGEAPDAAMELLLWQTLVGAWPISEERVCAYMEKAAREAKQRTRWRAPDPDYEARLEAVCRGAMADAPLRAEVERWVNQLGPVGERHALAALTLQVTCPGVPDVYQGSELWSRTLVDPDNRRPVDFGLRGRRLAALGASPDAEDAKLFTLARLLALRKADPVAFTRGSYEPLEVDGA